MEVLTRRLLLLRLVAVVETHPVILAIFSAEEEVTKVVLPGFNSIALGIGGRRVLIFVVGYKDFQLDGTPDLNSPTQTMPAT